MLSQAQRTTILELHTKGVGKREIARVLGISRPTVRKVLRVESNRSPGTAPTREGRTVPGAHSGAFQQLQGESRASP